MTKTTIPISKPHLEKDEINNVLKCIKSGWISYAGKYVQEFEKTFTNYLGGGFSVAVSNGTAAIELALRTFKIGYGDEVIIPNFTFAATINAVINSGAKPVLADVEKSTWTIDIHEIKKKITKKTKAIIAVHIYGQPAKIDEIKKIAKKHKVKIIEDSAEALGATYKGRKIGIKSDCATFSFFANKTITTGEGGMLVFKNKKASELAKLLRNQGQSLKKQFWHDNAGFNFRMTNIQAALGVAQMKKINKFISKRKMIFKFYNDKLKKSDKIKFLPSNSWSENSYWYYTILINNIGKFQRNRLIKTLKSYGIETRPCFYPLNTMEPYKKYAQGTYKVSYNIGQNAITLPTFYSLEKKQQSYIVKILLKILKKYENK